MAGSIQQVSDGNFKSEVLQSQTPVLVDFWAPWCGPCKAIAPMVEEVAGTYTGRVKVVKLNIDDNPESAVMFGVQSIPTLILFKDGKMAGRIIGAVPKSKVTTMIDKAF